MCNSLSISDLNTFRNCFYKKKDKRSQNEFILKHIVGAPPSRYRPRKANRKRADLRMKYFIYSSSCMEMIRVCQETFLNTLGINRYRVDVVSKQMQHNKKIQLTLRKDLKEVR